MNEIFEKQLNELSKRGLLTFEKNKPLSECSSFRIGGPVDYAVYPKCEEGLALAYNTAKTCGIPLRIIGNGTNVLFPDEGYAGAVIFTVAMKDCTFEGEKVTALCGKSMTSLAANARDKGLTGLEFVFGIPGSVGGGVYMNAGAYEHSVSEVLVSSRYFDPETGKFYELDGASHEFDYRHSSYMGTDRVIVSATFALNKGEKSSISETMDDYMQRRTSKQPLDYPSAGSVFKRYPGYFTGKLIEDSGLKGYTVGGAQVSNKHAGFIVNIGGATANDVKTLVLHIQNVIYEKYGIHIERELIYF